VAVGAALLDLVIGVVSAVLAVVLLQAWPPRYRWSKEISWTVGDETGRAIHRVKLGRGRRRIWNRRGGPIDVTFRARVAVTSIGTSTGENIVAIPVSKEWRPVIGRAVLVHLLPQDCDVRDLRHFPQEIHRKRADGTLRLDDLLRVGDAELRVYVFAYRRRVGTRWMLRQKYTVEAIQPGVFQGLKVRQARDGQPPAQPEPITDTSTLVRHGRGAPTFAVSIGRWSVELYRSRAPLGSASAKRRTSRW